MRAREYTQCCDFYEVCSQMCGITKNYCDEDFKSCLDQVCQTIQGIEEFRQCQNDIDILSSEMIKTKLEEYQKMQDQSCQCISEASTYDHYLELFQRFYSVHAPEKLLKSLNIIRDLLKKSTNDIVTTAKIYFELHKKYDKAIRFRGDRMGLEEPQSQGRKEL